MQGESHGLAQMPGSDQPKQPQRVYETILSNRESRNLLLCQVNELYYFYRQRVSESKQYSLNSLVSAYQSEELEKISEISLETLSEYAQNLKQCLNMLTDASLRQLLTIKE